MKTFVEKLVSQIQKTDLDLDYPFYELFFDSKGQLVDQDEQMK